MTRSSEPTAPDPTTAALGLLQDITTASSKARTAEDLLDACLASLLVRMDLALARVWLHHEAEDVLELRAAAGITTPLDGPNARVSLTGSKIGAIARSGDGYVTNEMANAPDLTDPAWVEREALQAFGGFPLRLGDDIVGVLALCARHPFDDDAVALLATVADALAVGLRRLRSDEALRDEAEIIQALYLVGRAVSRTHRTETVVQEITDAATRLTAAQFGAFFYNVLDERGEAYTLYAISGVPREAFARFPHPRNTAIFAPTFEGQGVLRLDDVTADPRYGGNDPHFGMPEGHLPVRSYLAVPVISGTKEVLGGLFLGHEEAGRFDQRAERLVTGIAQHAASALDAVRLFEGEHQLALQLQRTLLPRTLPPIPGLEIAARYQPASELAEVGGDWYDVSRLPDGTVSITVGDVAGHDLRAASTMGRLRHALQLYALDGFRPVEALERVDRLMARAGIAETATALHGILDPESGTLELCRAGHPSPLVLRADGTREWPEPTRYGGALLGGSSGTGPRTTLVVHLEPGDAVVLFTDGLVERPNELLDDGIARLVAAAAGCQGRSAADTCELLITELVGTENRDDVVVLTLKVV